MIHRVVTLAALAGAVVATAALAQGKVYKTPQEVFDASTAAAKKGDLKAYLVLVEPGSVDKIAAGLAITGARFRESADKDKSGKSRERMKPYLEVMDKNGLTAEALKKLKPIGPEKDPDKAMKAAKPLLDLVKDKPGFAAGALQAIQKMSKRGDEDFRVLATAKLKGLKVEGDRATGTISNMVEGKEETDPITFVKLGQSWYIRLNEEAKEKK